MKNYLKEEANKINIDLNEVQIHRFMDYYNMLVEWNSFMNLTGITDFKDVVVKHFIDSLAIIKSFDSKDYFASSNFSVIDVGTGAGFPGIPLKIVFPNLNITLLDSLKKRIDFLDQLIFKLKLNNIDTIHGRAEDYARLDNFRENYDFSISRAVANLSVLSEYCLPFVKKGGYFISYKSEKLEIELNDAGKAISLLGGKVIKQVDYNLNSNFRKLVLIEKISDTPDEYPRKSGKVSRNPIS